MKKRLLTMMMLLLAIVTRVNAQSDIVFDDLSLSKKAGGYLYGVCTNDKYIYACRWGKNPNYSYLFQVYDLYGEYILDGGGFNIQGVTGILDLTTDGKYFYGGVDTNQIYQMDFESHTLVSTITCEGAQVRHIAYDPVRDAFWLGSWTTLALYDRSGNKLQDGPAVPNAGGSSYYKDENGIEHLLLFCAKEANDAKVYDYNITTNTLSENPFFDYASNPNYVEGSYAGGCHVGLLRGRLCFFGLVQNNTIGVYPIKNAAYESNVVFHDDFEFRTSSIFFNNNTTNWTNVSSKQSDWHWRYTNETSGLTPFNGNYYITNTANDNDIIASPVLDLSECDAAKLKLQYANNSSQLSVLYRVNKNYTWSVLYTSEGSHDTWTEIELSLPNICSTYQIGLAAHGNNGFVSVDDVTITKHQHTYVPVITPATCTECGYTTFTCSECGDTYVGDETSALGHDFSTTTVGNVTTKSCSRCPVKIITTSEEACDYYYWSKNSTTYTATQNATYVDGSTTYNLNLTIRNSTTEIINADVFIGQHYIDPKYPNGFDFTVTNNTQLTQYYTTTNEHGCDHVVTLNLTLVDPGMPIDAEHFPDENFRNYLLSETVGMDGYLSDTDIASTQSLSPTMRNITDLTGIKYFTALQSLYCFGNQLTTLDVSGLDKLEILDCYNNKLTSINIQGCSSLRKLVIYTNNTLSKTAMEDIIRALPDRSQLGYTGSGKMSTVNGADLNESMHVTKRQQDVASDKNWEITSYYNTEEYLGKPDGNGIFISTQEYDYYLDDNKDMTEQMIADGVLNADGDVTYNPDEGKMTLDNAKIDGCVIIDSTEDAPSVTIEIIGNNEINSDEEVGLLINSSDIDFTGDGTLSVDGEQMGIIIGMSYNGHIIDSDITVEVDAPTIVTTGETMGICIMGNGNITLDTEDGVIKAESTGTGSDSYPILLVTASEGKTITTLPSLDDDPSHQWKDITTEADISEVSQVIAIADGDGNTIKGTSVMIGKVEEPQPENYYIYIIYPAGSVHGELFVNSYGSKKGTVITVTCIPDEGYQLKSLRVECNDEELPLTTITSTELWETTGYNFTMPEGSVMIYPLFEKRNDQPTAISEKGIVNSEKADSYTLGGTKASDKRSGVVIINGKKVIRK